MDPASAIAAELALLGNDAHEIHRRISPINARVPGWSGAYHWMFFKALLTARPKLKTVLMLGVYMGRDITYLLDAAGPQRALQVVGVDKFSDTPCGDWPEEKRGLSWGAAGFGEPPDAKKALDNINPQEPHAVRLIEGDDALWLDSVGGSFDLLYLDTAHDRATVERQLRQVKLLCHSETVVAGDDYANIVPTWGVKDAVTAGFRTHQVLAETIWFANAGDLK